MSVIVSLEQLRDHAAGKPNHPFPLNDPACCLGAECAGRPMFGYSYFCKSGSRDCSDDKAPPQFAQLLKAVNSFDRRTGGEVGVFTGEQLAVAVQNLISGMDPRDAASAMCDAAGVHV